MEHSQCPRLTGMELHQCPHLTGIGLSLWPDLTGWEYSTVKICQSILCYTICLDTSQNLKKKRFKKDKMFHLKLFGRNIDLSGAKDNIFSGF